MTRQTLDPEDPRRPETEKFSDRTRKFLARNRWRVIFTVAISSILATLALNPLGELKHKAIEAAPWVGIGILVGEIMFLGGLVMMASGVGIKAGNPFRLKSNFARICQLANHSHLFMAGFWVNSLGAVGSAVAIVFGVVLHLPWESYGILTFAAVDLMLTIAIRKAILDGLKKSGEESGVTLDSSVA
ncbi:hypothetical protein FEF34_17020 [Streptomyces marianii]|uniref:Uncharacterized protein n=2 Tax=Streptomyces marianii TaxID=1817406 RepID=A0A5R9E3Q4_9ACTN|nr:hypothetical protein FEF34_17020 [Streptomyces marianii]